MNKCLETKSKIGIISPQKEKQWKISQFEDCSTPFVFFCTFDHLETVRVITNSSWPVVSKHNFEPYSVEIPPYNDTASNTHKYTGHERDASTGYDYMHFRFYASSIGRFMKPDNVTGSPLNPQNWNLYSYVRGNPVNMNDPTGHWGSAWHWTSAYLCALDAGVPEGEAVQIANGAASGDEGDLSPTGGYLTGKNGIIVNQHGFRSSKEESSSMAYERTMKNVTSPDDCGGDLGMQGKYKIHPAGDTSTHSRYVGNHLKQGTNPDITSTNLKQAVQSLGDTVKAIKQDLKAEPSTELIDIGNKLAKLDIVLAPDTTSQKVHFITSNTSPEAWQAMNQALAYIQNKTVENTGEKQ